MKEIKKTYKSNFFKKIFIKICRLLGFEIIDQSKFYVPTQRKLLDDNLNIAGKKSIIIPLGETPISREIKSLTVIFRSCAKVNMLTQNKKRLFEKNKSEYTIRSLNSIIKAIKHAEKNFSQIKFKLIIIDHNSDDLIVNKMKNLLDKSNLSNSIISLNLAKFANGIEKINAEKKPVSENQKSNMANIHQSLLIAKNECDDLIYFVEDDYIHEKESFNEMIYTYERISSLIKKELILCPSDYPYLYTKLDKTNIFLGSSKHWRVID